MAQEKTSIEIPSMTVFGIKKPDNSFTQFSEVEWHQANDSTIVAEQDGSYTADSTTNSFSLKNLFESLGKPKVNIDLDYALNSVSMTAEGSLMLDTLLEAFAYLKSDTTLELTPITVSHDSASQKIMHRRLEALLMSIARDNRVKIQVMPTKVSSQKRKTSARLDTWSIQLRLKASR